MVQILEANPRDRSLKEKFSSAFANAAQEGVSSITKHKAKEAFASKIDKQSPLMAELLRSGLPADEQKAILSAFKSSGSYSAQQQERLSQDSILNRYGKRIKEIDETLKNPFASTNADLPALRAQKEALQAERDKLLGFQALQKDLTPMEEEKPTEKQKKKMKNKFDANNPKHKARRDEVLKKTKGDRAKAEKVLLEEFDL